MPTIYELTKITPPRVVNGFEQDPIDGVSMVYTFGDAKAPGTRKTQFFDIMASRGIYHDGWFASAPGPREPWVGGMPKGIKEWSPLTDKWELYNLDEDWSQANDLAAANPQKLEEMKVLFLLESTKNKNLPIGGGLWSTAMFHPEDAPASPLTEWTFDAPSPGCRNPPRPSSARMDSLVTMEVDVPANANGVLYALAGFSGGITCYVKDGFLNYEFNLFEVQRTKIKSKDKLPTGKVKIEVESKLADKIGGPMDVTLKVNGEVVAQGRVPAAMSLHFTSNATFDIGTDLDSPVSLDYFDQAPFAFNGTIGTTKITYLEEIGMRRSSVNEDQRDDAFDANSRGRAVGAVGGDAVGARCRHARRRLGAAVPAGAVGEHGGAARCRTRCTSAARSRTTCKAGAPNVLIILLDDVGFGQAVDLRRRDQHADAEQARRARASATTPSTPRRSARRRAPRCSPGATTSASATARSPSARSTGTATPA